MGPAKRSGLINIDKEFITSVIFRQHWGNNNDKFPTTKPKIFIEYRIPHSYDKHLNFPPFRSNTKGLMIRMAFEEVKIPVGTFKDAWEREFEITKEIAHNDEKYFESVAFLLDMSPMNGSDKVTLNPGRKFYHKDWELIIGNVRPQEAKGILFDVNMGSVHETIPSGVYKTKLFDGESITPFSETRYYTDPNTGQKYEIPTLVLPAEEILFSEDLNRLLSINETELFVSNLQTELKGWTYSIPQGKTISKIEFKEGRLFIQGENETLWQTEETDYPFANLVIDKDGELKREIKALEWNQADELPTYEYIVDLDSDGDNDGVNIWRKRLVGKQGTQGENLWETKIDLFYNTGNGNFQKKSIENREDGFNFSKINFIDLDRDGDMDMIVNVRKDFLEYDIGKILTFFNVGNQNFEEKPLINHSEENISSALLIDYNSDGYDDILISGHDKEKGYFSKLFINEKEGVFEENKEILFNTIYPKSIECIDLDADGDNDILVHGRKEDKTLRYISQLFFFENTGFHEYQLKENVLFEEPREVRWYKTVDIDEDGSFDIFSQANLVKITEGAAFGGGDDINIENDWEIYLYRYTNNFKYKKEEDFHKNQEWSRKIECYDFNEDGYQDIIESGIKKKETVQYHKIYFNDKSGTFKSTPDFEVPHNLFVVNHEVADFDFDGDLDLMLYGANEIDNDNKYLSLEFLFNKGDGKFFGKSIIVNLVKVEMNENKQITNMKWDRDLSSKICKIYPLVNKYLPVKSDE
jgi:hypothetical protein